MNKIIMLSIDALNTMDLEFIKTLPNFSMIINNGAVAREVKGVYPTHTYTTHTSLITATYPNKHGISSNYIPKPGSTKPDWFWFYNKIRGKTLIDICNDNNLTTLALLWPVTAKAPISYNLPEIWDPNKKKSQLLLSLLNGSPLFLLKNILKYRHLRDDFKQPYLDNFISKISIDTLSKKDIDFSLIHFTDLDSTRHAHGVHSKESKDALMRIDEKLGNLFDALKKKGEFEKYNFFLFGDHGFLDFNKKININRILKKNKYIIFNNKEELILWKAWGHSCEGSCHIYLSENNQDLYKEVAKLLKKIQSNPIMGIEKVYEKEDFNTLKSTNNPDFILEAKKGYSFTSNWVGAPIEEVSKGVDKHVAAHGYSPNKDDYTSLFLAMGPDIKKNITLDKINIVDIPTTISYLMKSNLDESEGIVIESIIKK